MRQLRISAVLWIYIHDPQYSTEKLVCTRNIFAIIEKKKREIKTAQVRSTGSHIPPLHMLRVCVCVPPDPIHHHTQFTTNTCVHLGALLVRYGRSISLTRL